MPARRDLSSILVIGSGPIVIGQACEFDYSGTQACRVLKEEGYRVILANSNPATIMTDPATADATYVEPLDADVLEAIIAAERPDAILPTLGGQTALNLTMQLVERGVPERYGLEVIGARPEAIETAEDRDKFKQAMTDIGLAVPESGFAHSLEEAIEIARGIGFPIMVRPSYILGGQGTGIAPDESAFQQLASEGLAASPVGEIGWKAHHAALHVTRPVVVPAWPGSTIHSRIELRHRPTTTVVSGTVVGWLVVTAGPIEVRTPVATSSTVHPPTLLERLT